jgi:serine/threonine-protein kinase RIO1
MLHACGLEHGDLHEGNIRFEEDKQRAWIIDFTHAKKHDCRRKQLVLGDDVPEFSEYGCEELYDMAIDTRVWISYGN